MIDFRADMQYRRLGKTELKVSTLGLGSGGPNLLGQMRSVPSRQIVSLIRGALDRGVNFFDTAAGYLDSEVILGKAFTGISRDRFLLATKFRPTTGATVIRPTAARALVEKSLVRCRVDELDLLQLHCVEPPQYMRVRDDLFPELERLKREGKARFLGITESSRRDPGHRMLEMALEDNLFDTVMAAYSPANPTAEVRVFPMALERDVGVIVMAAARHLVPGGLSSRFGQFVRSMRYALGSLPQPETFLRQSRGALSFLGRSPARWPPEFESSMPGLAYAFAATPEAVACVLSGTTNPVHLEENISSVLESPVTREVHERLIHHLRYQK